METRANADRVPSPRLPRPQFLSEEHLMPSIERLKDSANDLKKNVQYVKGVGPALAERFKKADIERVEDLLMFFPTRYEDRRKVTSIGDLTEGTQAIVFGNVVFAGVAFYRGLRRRVFEVTLNDGTGTIKLKWFRFLSGTLEQRIKRDQKLIVCGKVQRYRNQIEMHHPDFEVSQGKIDSLSFGKIVPVYREVGAIYQKTLRKIQFGVVSAYGDRRSCVIPTEVCKKFDLMPPWRAIRELHQPSTLPIPDRRSEAERSLSFEELFFYCLSLGLRKRKLTKRPGISFNRAAPRYDQMMSNLPFELTSAQKRILENIRKDMAAEHPMNRLLQGDVGSGKTIVAFLAGLVAIDHGYQVAFMVPTEILADQHGRTLTRWGEKAGIRVATLLGRHSMAERKPVLEALLEGELDFVVGTHALLEEKVNFSKLGLVVVDEQHRFGVRQRAVLRSKGVEPDVLVMSATPIPRTLALTLYGDLDVSLLDELPKGRKPIETKIFADKERARVYEAVRKEVGEGRQAYVVYPLVEESEHLPAKDATNMERELRENIFPEFKVTLVHGQMPAEEKGRVMSLFEKGEIQILVSTTVIEVGIDVANATVMVIEHPERFGLSQLHQLRGRVGRGSERSFCFLIRPAGISKLAYERLRTFASIHDGFLLAEEDLRLRGPGDFFGVAQSGFPSFRVANFPRDLDLLEAARQEAFRLIESDPDLKAAGHQHLSWVLDTHWGEKISLVRVG